MPSLNSCAGEPAVNLIPHRRRIPRRSPHEHAPPPLPVHPAGLLPLCSSSAAAPDVLSAYSDPQQRMFHESESSSYSDDPDNTDTIDSTEICTLEDYIIEDNVLDAWGEWMVVELKGIAVELKDELEAAIAGPSYTRSTTKRRIERERVETQQRLASAISEGTRHLTERTAALSRNRHSVFQKSIAKSKHNAKRRVKESVIGEEQKNIIEAQTTAKNEHTKTEQLQLQIASQKLQSAKLAYLAAKEKNESKMLDFYNELLVADTSRMTEDIKVERLEALKCMRKRLFDNQG